MKSKDATYLEQGETGKDVSGVETSVDRSVDAE